MTLAQVVSDHDLIKQEVGRFVGRFGLSFHFCSQIVVVAKK